MTPEQTRLVAILAVVAIFLIFISSSNSSNSNSRPHNCRCRCGKCKRRYNTEDFLTCAGGDSPDPCCKQCDAKKGYTDSAYSGAPVCAQCRGAQSKDGATYSLANCKSRRTKDPAGYSSADPSSKIYNDILACGCAWKGKGYSELYPDIPWSQACSTDGGPVVSSAQAKRLVNVVNSSQDSAVRAAKLKCIMENRNSLDNCKA